MEKCLTAAERASADELNAKWDDISMNPPSINPVELEERERRQAASRALRDAESEEWARSQPVPKFDMQEEYYLRKRSAMLRIQEEEEYHEGSGNKDIT
ncbi:hypothetical protein VTL71DRAFT_9712 [Oculimacula yallundae]|uniref:Uncharacterized protein n=1 Tax=Oculimacula yallundae TaxID=86028 RepID=A0ABR4BSG8_9HELO